jgi:hypothetical protein
MTGAEKLSRNGREYGEHASRLILKEVMIVAHTGIWMG